MKQRNSKPDAARISVRRARAADLPALIRLYKELHLDDYSYRSPSLAEMRRAFNSIARNRDHQILVAESHGEVIGALHIMIFRHLGHGLRPVGVIENVVVSAAHRSRGVGELMMAAADKIARRYRCYKMSLTTNLKRARAHQFYERLGWRRTHFGYSLELRS
jgi:GNAT superfamily N-acetyltransferase